MFGEGNGGSFCPFLCSTTSMKGKNNIRVVMCLSEWYNDSSDLIFCIFKRTLHRASAASFSGPD